MKNARTLALICERPGRLLSNQTSAPAIVFQTETALGLHDADDPDVLALAAREGRVPSLARPLGPMPDHFREFTLTQTSPDVIIVSQKMSIGRAAELLHVLSRGERSRRIQEHHLRSLVASHPFNFILPQ